ncbi:MAG: proprotein convertase P-domain-containing protein [Crocinitomicaceae bacterium]|nr:proprotein convertase P-domain-containing protein [Crocinitomicaceae bacterium]
MRKNYKKWKSGLLLCFLFATAFSSLQAQVVNTYGFSATSGTYTPLVGGTTSGLAATADDNLSAALPIGFNFVYGGTTFTTFKVCSNGAVYFGTGATTALNNLATATASQRPGLAPLWDDLQCTSGINYLTTGAPGSQVLTIQFATMEWNWQSTTSVISFQVKLYEGTNRIDFVYQQEATPVSSGSASIGLMGLASTDFISLQGTGAAPTRSTTVSTNTLNAKPATGQIYSWMAAPAAPSAITEVAGSPDCITGTNIEILGAPTNPDVVWYWQGTNAAGTSTASNANTPLNVLTNGTYYARAYNTVFDVWSTTSTSIIISSIPTAATPPAPTADINPSCFTTGSVLTAAAATAPITYYWQSVANGTSTASDASTPLSVATTGTYYLSAFDASNSCWSSTSDIAVTVTTSAPAAPSPVQSTYVYCSTDSPMDIEVAAAVAGCPISVTISSSGWGDGTTWTVTDNLGATVLSGGTYGNGYSDTQSIPVAANGPYNLNITSTASDNFPNYSVSVDGSVVFSGTAPASTTTIIGTFTCPAPVITPMWYDAATAGTMLGTGATLNALGTIVLPVATAGTYDFYAANEMGGCESTRELVQVIVSEVSVALTAIDETCTGYGNGSFALSTVNCGTGPFLYSVDGGLFGAIPTDLTAGTYSIVVQDATLLESSPITLVIGTTSTVIPDAPVAVQSVYNYCVTSNPMDIEVETVPAGCPIDINVFSASWGDGTTWTVTDNIGTVVLSGGTYGNGYNDLQSIPAAANGPYNLNLTSTFGDNSPSYSVTLNGTVIFSGTAPANTTTVVGPFTCPQGGTPEWFSAATAGNFEGTGAILNALGTSVIPVAAEGAYEFYAFNNLDGCYSATSTLVTVNLSSVLVDFTPIDETCIGYANGSFAIANVDCGTGPFLYSVDGGAFGAIPTNLTAGTYSIVVQDATMAESAPVSITIGSTDTFIPEAPTATVDEYFICTGETTQLIEAIASGSGSQTVASGTITIAIPDSPNPGISSDLIMSNVPVGATITDISVTMNVTHTFDGDLDITLTGPNATTIELSTDNGGAGDNFTNTVFSNTAVTAVTAGAAPFTGSFLPEGDLTTLFSVPNGTWTLSITDDAGGDIGTLDNWSITISYTLPSITVEWYDMATNGNLEGTGSPFESVGTGLLSTPAAVGSYEFYAGALAGACYSTTRTLVTVNVNDVNIELTAVDASCNNSPTGSFIISNVICGTGPFTFNVDGAGFGPIPTDLMAGTYSVEVMDDLGGTSAAYTLVVGEAGAPSGSYMEDITDNGGQVSWTANGNETEWNVEWGLPGFTPGTGTEIGSTQAMDTFAIITGLDGNTNYDVYISANCGAGTTTGAWDMVNWTTDCGIYTLPFEETFEDNSITRVCWYNINEIGTADWTYQTGSSGGTVTTAFEGTKNARFVSTVGTGSPISKLASPRFDFAGQDSVALIFAYAQEVWFGDQNITKVYTAGAAAAWTEIASYSTNVNAWTIDTLFISDTTVQIAFEGINNFGHANVVDHVRFMPCTLNSGIDGSSDVCRLDGTFDLNTIVTKGEDFGTWSFAQNPGVLNGSIVSVSALPAGTFEFYYIVKTPCATDTTTATLTIFPPSSAGVDGTITACRNEPIYLLSGLTGNVDLGGQWYNPSNSPTDVSITTSNFPGSYNYDYIVSNGVCPNDTSNILVTVGTCDYLDIQELVFGDMNVYPNPTDGLVFISNASSSETFNYELLDVKGQVLSAKMAAINGTTTTEISLEKLEPGVYMIKVYNTEAEKTFRIIKQ